MTALTGQRFVDAVEENLRGLTAVSTGVCPGCEQCRAEYGIKTVCPTCDGQGWTDENPDEDCPECEGDGEREPTPEEFHEQWSRGDAHADPHFTWQGCDICGSRLGCSAEPWHAIDEETGEIIHGEHACPDCACYLANGDIPE